MSNTLRAGDIRQCTINNREYDPAAESSATIMPGAPVNSVKRNGNGTLHTTQAQGDAGIKGLALSLDDERGDLEALAAVAKEGVPVPVTISLVSGVAYSGNLVLVSDELGKSTGEGTVTIDLLGERFEKI